MSITDELKEYVWQHANNNDELRAIADRIDAEHERECKEQYACGAEHGIGASIDALVIQTHGFVELPKDADGETIHVGDVMESNGANSLFGQASFEVRAMRYDEGGWEVYDRLGDRYMPSLLRHHHALTVEDVLREFADEVYADADNEIRDRDFLCAKYAKRLTLAEGEDA